MRRNSLVFLTALLTGAVHAGSANAHYHEQLCARYAGHATSEATVARDLNCGFTGPRWTTQGSDHLNWCLSNFAAAGSDANALVRAREIADAEDRARIAAIQECQARLAAAPPAPAAPAPPAPTAATVNADVDLYDSPGGTVIGMLRAQQPVAFVGCRDDNWCQVIGGWVWGDFLNR